MKLTENQMRTGRKVLMFFGCFALSANIVLIIVGLVRDSPLLSVIGTVFALLFGNEMLKMMRWIRRNKGF